MKNLVLILIIGLIALTAITGCSSKERNEMETPKVKKNPKELTIHNDTRIDNYYWLNQRENPEVIKYLDSENEYLKNQLEHTEELQDELYKEIIGRLKQDDSSVPYKKNGYFYYSRYEEGKEYPLYCRKKESLDASEEIMLNVNVLAKDYSYYAVAGRNVSPDNKWLAFGVDTLSRRIYTINFKNLETGEVIKESIPNTMGNVVWANDNKTLFYAVKDSTLRPYKIIRHKLGTSADQDVEVYHEKDATFNCYVKKSKSGDYIFIHSNQTVSTEWRFIDAERPDDKFKIIQPRERGLEYSVEHYGDSFYILNNLEAENFKLIKTPVNKTEKSNWIDVINHREDVLLEEVDIFNKYLVLSEREKALTNLRVINWKDLSEYNISFDEEVYTVNTFSNFDFDTKKLRFKYSSLTTPSTVYDFNLESKERELLKRDEVVGGYNLENYETKRIWATASDGVKVPISVVYKKGVELDGTNPTLLYGYGSYGYSYDPGFRSYRLSLLDRGFVFAIAHIRGGKEMGQQWYEDGKLLNKKNTFTDFIACGEELIKQNYTNKDKLCAMGGSAGGLLMGAVINMRPDLWKAVIASVPFVDVVTTMLDESIPLTTGEYDEWGNPNIREYYEYILTYSPYDNVEAKEYPAMLVTTGLHDSQVQYWEPAKWVAKLRELKTDDNLLMLSTNMETGHGGASGRFERYKEIAMEFAFLLDQVKK